MKKVILLLTVFIFIAGFTAYRIADRNISDILSQLNISDDDARQQIMADIAGCYFGYPYPGDLKNTPMKERAAIVNAVGNYVKEFVKTDAFRQKYAEYRLQNRPEAPAEPEPVEVTKKKHREELIAGIKNTEETMKALPADQRTYLGEALKVYRTQLKELDDPNNSYYGPETQKMMAEGYKMQLEQYKETLARWEEEYPEKNPEMLVKRWIVEFLTISADIDFNAKLKDNGYGKMIFVNPEYESRPSLWKLFFRSGKETTEAARAFALRWLSEIEAGKQ